MDTAIVHVADVVALAMELGHSGEKYPPPLDPEAWACLGLSERVLGPLLGEVEQQFGDALWVFFNDAVESTVRC
jgi:hypothetical protein